MEDGVLKLKDKNGNEKVYTVLFTFEEEESYSKYVVYTDYTVNKNGRINIYSNGYKIEKKQIILIKIENKEILQFIEEKLQELTLYSKD